MISRDNIDDAVQGYIRAMLESAIDKFRLKRGQIGPGDVPKHALLSIRRDVTAFVKKNEDLIEQSTMKQYGRMEPILSSPVTGWMYVGYALSLVRNEDEFPGIKLMTFRELGWHPEPITQKLDLAAWAFPQTKLLVEDVNSPEPRLYFWTGTEKKR